MQDIDELRKQHPTWTPGNTLLLSEHEGEDAIRIETLLSEPCWACHKEMGAHLWRDGSYHCPKGDYDYTN